MVSCYFFASYFEFSRCVGTYSSAKFEVYYLKMTKSIDKLALGCNRDKDIHMKTISAVQDIDISGDIVLLMDDVTTTGNSLYACKEILLEQGAKTVKMFALGKAV